MTRLVFQRNRTPRRVLRLVALLGLALASGAGGLPASATHATAAPTIDAYGLAPNNGRITGGTSFRITGTGFHAAGGVTVVFDKLGYTANATKVTVVDDNLITAQSPASPLNSTGETTVKVVTVNGTAENHIFNGGTGWFFWDPASNTTGSAEPKLTTTSSTTGLANGSSLNVTASGYPAGATIHIAQASPLATFLEPRRWGQAPNPEIKILASPTADANGAWSGTVNVIQGSLGATDPAAQCPTTQAQADAGGGRCWLVAVSYGRYIARLPIAFATGEPTGAAATVNRSAGTSFSVGQSIAVTGDNWRASPVIGSSTNLTNLVGTQLTIQICGINGVYGSCSATSGTGSVAVTRYFSSYGGTLNPGTTNGALTGATLSGSITVGADLSGACNGTTADPGPSCFVKVVQTKDATHPGADFNQSERSTRFSVS